jgi:hypothetical protein
VKYSQSHPPSHFLLTLKANENKIFADGLEEIRGLLYGAGKDLGGELCVVELTN